MGCFKEEDYENNSWQELLQKLDKKVQETINTSIESHALDLLYAVGACESPIEQLMAIALESLELKCVNLADNGCFVINPQCEIGCLGNKYRADFLICTIFQGKSYELVIECDGHDYHEKTKEQARRDKRRDRNMTKAGYIVMRFTGSEIWKNPYKCASEALSTIFPFRV